MKFALILLLTLTACGKAPGQSETLPEAQPSPAAATAQMVPYAGLCVALKTWNPATDLPMICNSTETGMIFYFSSQGSTEASTTGDTTPVPMVEGNYELEGCTLQFHKSVLINVAPVCGGWSGTNCPPIPEGGSQ